MSRSTKLKYCRVLVSVLFLFTEQGILFSQNNKIDSLYKIFNSEKQDTTKINLLYSIAGEWGKTNLDSATAVGKKIVELAEKTDVKEKIANAYYAYGMGYFLKGDYPRALKQHFKCLQVTEKAKMPKLHGRVLVTIGNAFMMQADYEKSLIYYHKAFALFQKNNVKDDMARAYSNIGLVYAYQSNTEKALFYFKKSLEYRDEAPNDAEKAITYDFIGFAYINDKNYFEALNYLNASLELNRKINNPVRIMDNLRNMGECHLKLGAYKLAEKELMESLALSNQYGYVNGVEGNSVLLYELHKQNKDFSKALQFYVRYIKLRDSLYNQENTRNSLQQEIQFEYDKKAAVDSIRVVAEKKVTAARFKNEQTQRYALYGGLVIVGLFALFMVNRFRVINKQKQIIDSQKKIVEEQKFIVEEKQKEVLDSINYAKRIQLAHLPSEQYLLKNFKRLLKEI